MRRSEVAYLGAPESAKDAYGVIHESIEWRKVYVGVKSVSAQEFFEGGKSGFRPEWRFELFKYDYEGESLIDYDGAIYTIYRTYDAGSDVIELYAERRLGNE